MKSGRIPIVSLECVSCKAQSRYEISQNSYVYLAGTCSNCQGSYRGVRGASLTPTVTPIQSHRTASVNDLVSNHNLVKYESGFIFEAQNKSLFRNDRCSRMPVANYQLVIGVYTNYRIFPDYKTCFSPASMFGNSLA